ncbi:flavodoxin domain-containing protein [Coprothermobacter platensis]|uniref:flavodoxin domain-containing protein n=1 Tax=Coprothermobacter platensis TaxID=108819 RepID=UPI00035C3799|nr:flavodoxin domain-containing protein [Coprothermobacter platensis]
MQVQVIYASRHGASKKYAEAIAEVLDGEAMDMANTSSFWGDAVVFVCGVYEHKLNPDLMSFIDAHKGDLYGRMWAGVAVSLIDDERVMGNEKIGGPIYVRQYLSLFDRPPLALGNFPGAVYMDQLTSDEKEQVKKVFDVLGKEPGDIDNVDTEKVWTLSNRIKEIARQC